MPKKTFLDAVDVPAPCSTSWNEMTGDDKTRFCASCEKDIHNISAMTKREARKLLYESKEKLCIRIEKDADGKIKTLKKQFHQITRRAPLAASVLSASLTFSALTYAQGEPVVSKPESSVSAAHKQTRATVSGTVTDAIGSLVPGAAIKLINVKDNSARNALSNAEGFYEFKDVAAAIYRIEAEASVFKKFVSENIEIDGNKNAHLTITLGLTGEVVGLFLTEAPLPENTEPAKVSDKIDPKRVEDLPINNRKHSTLLGLFPNVAQNPPKKVSAKQENKTSQISFTVYDPNDAVVPAAQVKLTNQKTKQEFVALTDQQGTAYLSLIPHGKYVLEVSANEFRADKKVIQIKEPVEPNIKITLEVGSFTGVVSIDWSEIPLFRAIAQDNNETVKQAINANFNLNTKDESGQTALHVAVQHENLEIVRFLLDKGAKTNVKDKQKRTPLAMVFEAFGDNDEATMCEIICMLVAKGADIDVRNDDDGNMTFLMTAAEDDNLQGVKFFLELGSNPNLKDEDGETAMQKTDSDEIKQLLRRYGARQ